MLTEAFLDASYAVALSSARDTYHGRATALAERLADAETRLLTTQAALLASLI